MLSPKTSRSYSVPALEQEYAAGISLWQHKVIKNYQRKHSDSDQNLDGWLQAKSEISRLIDESLNMQRARAHKRIARYREVPEELSLKPSTNELEAQTSRATNAGSRTAKPVAPIDAENQSPIPLRTQIPPFTRPRFKAEIREIYDK